MIVEAKIKTVMNIDIEPNEAFRILCETLQMKSVLNENDEFFVKEDEYGDNCVYRIHDGDEIKYDDRGNLFVALRNVAVNMFPNLHYRKDYECNWLNNL